LARCQWLTPVILATQEAEIRWMAVQSQPGLRDLEILSQKHPSRKRAGRVDQVEALSSNSIPRKNNNNTKYIHKKVF
jgi:hypothetical protein